MLTRSPKFVLGDFLRLRKLSYGEKLIWAIFLHEYKESQSLPFPVNEQYYLEKKNYVTVKKKKSETELTARVLKKDPKDTRDQKNAF